MVINKKQQLIYNALVLDRDETKRALQMPNVAPATAELLAAKLIDLSELIQEFKQKPVKTFPEGGIVGGEDTITLPGGKIIKPYQQKVADKFNELAAQGKTITIDTGRRAGKSTYFADLYAKTATAKTEARVEALNTASAEEAFSYIAAKQ